MKFFRFTSHASCNLAHTALVLFLVILLLQSALGLFIPVSDSLDSIDILLRSALSSIFGYLMSNVGQQSVAAVKNATTAPRTIGFSSSQEVTSSTEQEPSPSPKITAPPQQTTPIKNSQLQTLIIAALGFFCLTVLILLRYFGSNLPTTSGAIATVTQYRDMISGSIGALIGLARGQNSQ